MKNKIVLIGAGSAMFGLGALGDIFKSKSLEGSIIVLYDINQEALCKVEKITRQYVIDYKLNYEIASTTSITDALINATFCIISIEVGNRYELWEQDWHIPLQFGIKQVYGENGGPGGLFHALRIIPPILEICGAIHELCPDSYVFNLSNPLTSINMAIQAKYPELKVIGVCHEIASLLEHLPCLLNVPFEKLSVKAGGLNHFSILVEATYSETGRDAYPDIRNNAFAYFNNKPEHSLILEMIRLFGYLPITSDSHFSEYIQWAQDVVDHQGVLDFYNNYRKTCLVKQHTSQRLKMGTLPREYWRVIPIIEGIVKNSGHEELAVNIPNNGIIASLPNNIFVEVPATIDKDGVHPVKSISIPIGFAGLLNNRVGCLNLTVEAVLLKSKELVMQALLVDPTVNNLHAAEKTLDTIMQYQSEYLGYLL